MESQEIYRREPKHAAHTPGEIQERLGWMHAHPGEWLHWSIRPRPASARGLDLYLYERRRVFAGAGEAAGLHVRYLPNGIEVGE